VISFDGAQYDCHTPGEYVLMDNAKANEAVHNQQTKIPYQGWQHVPPLNGGVAMRSGNQVFSLQLEQPQWQQFIVLLKFNGQLVPYPSERTSYGDFVVVPNGGELPAPDSPCSHIGFASTMLSIINRRTHTSVSVNYRCWGPNMRYLDIHVSNALLEFRGTPTRGLCGTYNGNPADDLVSANGAACSGANSNACCLSWRVAAQSSLFPAISGDLSFQGMCTLAPTCATGWTDHGYGGVILNNHHYGLNPFAAGGAFNGGWTWTHPRICCANSKTAKIGSQYMLSKSCPGGTQFRGLAGVIMNNNAIANQPFSNGGAFNPSWTWTHPHLCKVDKVKQLKDHVQPTCVFAASCPAPWEDFGMIGLITPTPNRAHLSQALHFGWGGDFNGAWHWTHPRLCCIRGGQTLFNKLGFGVYNKRWKRTLLGNDIGHIAGTSMECAEECLRRDNCKGFIRSNSAPDTSRASCWLKSKGHANAWDDSISFFSLTSRNESAEKVCQRSNKLAVAKRVCARAKGLMEQCMMEVCSGDGGADVLRELDLINKGFITKKNMPHH